EQNDYLPFGTRMPLKTRATNRYRYSGKEEQNIAGVDLSLLDFGARYYDAYTCRWNAIDPMANKYFGMSPYNYCGNDPVNRVDPDGKRVVYDKNCSDDFKSKFKAAVVFMNEKGTSGNLAQLDKSSNVYNIADGRGKKSRNHFNSKTSTISWDPDCMYATEDGIWVSATTILCHEIDHANNYDKDPIESKKNNIPNSDEQFGTQEERRACKNEQKTAEKHGEVSKGQKVRNSHNGGEYFNNGGASPEEQSKACRENNDKLNQL
ncbi:MAG: RHS repeat-associated core domain-containing protein, partial [Bacteroidales bacterium]|nr:RHS repeat-associated core domain-containing protein [Candidatus Cryptobacteroides onthequi]